MSIPLRSLLFLLLSVVVTADYVHDMLPKYGLPVGLVPDSVKNYSLTPNNEFEIDLQSPCSANFGENLVTYKNTIKGKVSYGSITNLQGIQAQKSFIFVTIDTIIVHSANSTIEFKVGALSQSLPLNIFEKIPTCKA